MAWRLLHAGIRVRARVHTHVPALQMSRQSSLFMFPGALAINSLILPLSPCCSIHSCAASSRSFSPPFLCFFSSTQPFLLSSTMVRIFRLSFKLCACLCNWTLLFFFPLLEFYHRPLTVSCWRTWCLVWTITCVCWPFLTTQSHH